jgi:hypothetical protein
MKVDVKSGRHLRSAIDESKGHWQKKKQRGGMLEKGTFGKVGE